MVVVGVVRHLVPLIVNALLMLMMILNLVAITLPDLMFVNEIYLLKPVKNLLKPL